MDWSNLSNNTTGSKLSTAQPTSSSKLLLNMRNESPPTNSLPALFFGSRPNLPGLEDHPGSGGGLLYGNFDGSDQESADVEASDHEALHPAEKKRRLSVEQVKSLEMSFEIENKLEPERKKQLAHELGLQPRQVAVWFQNRRARWKTKQLERDYEALKASYDGLLLENKKLQAEVSSLVAKLETKAGDITQQKPEMFTAVTSKKTEELLEESVTVAAKNHEDGNLILIEDMDVVASCKPVKATEKEGSPCSDGGYTSEILDAEYPAAEPVPVVEENNDHVLTFEDQGFDMESTTVKVLKDEADGMVYDPHSNQLVLYKFEDGLVYNDYDNTSSFYYLPPDAMGPWWA